MGELGDARDVALSRWEAWVLRRSLGACPGCGVPAGYSRLQGCAHDEAAEVAGQIGSTSVG